MAIPGYRPTPEFEATVSSGNLLKTRIMLTNSMVVDPTGKQFSEMLEYAKRKLDGLFVPYDGELLESDQAKWDLELMNQELSLLVNNFSYERISHLWRVIRKVRKEDIRRLEYLGRTAGKAPPPAGVPRSGGSFYQKAPVPISGGFPKTAASPSLTEDEKKQERIDALSGLQKAGREVERIMGETEHGKKWYPQQVVEMKKAAQNILRAVEKYEKNK